MQVTEYIHKGAFIAVYRPELTEEERKRRESNIRHTLNCFSRGKQNAEKKN